MLLLIDIGNSSTTIGLHEAGMRRVFRVRTALIGSDDETCTLLLRGVTAYEGCSRLEGAVICSVVPEVTPLIAGSLREKIGIKPFVVKYSVKTGLQLKVQYPERVGSDRLATAAGARALYRGAVTVVDFGTATTFCSVSAKGEYRSGPIMPGLAISADALAERTAQLPRIDIRSPFQSGEETIEEKILQGLILGHAGGAERILNEMQKDSGIKSTVVATGGFAELIAPYMKGVRHVAPFLTLEGLRIIFSLNRSARRGSRG